MQWCGRFESVKCIKKKHYCHKLREAEVFSEIKKADGSAMMWMRCESKTIFFFFFFILRGGRFFIKDCRGEISAGIVPNDCCSMKRTAESCWGLWLFQNQSMRKQHFLSPPLCRRGSESGVFPKTSASWLFGRADLLRKAMSRRK